MRFPSEYRLRPKCTPERLATDKRINVKGGGTLANIDAQKRAAEEQRELAERVRRRCCNSSLQFAHGVVTVPHGPVWAC